MVQGKRESLAQGLDRVRVPEVLFALRKRFWSKHLVVINLHRVNVADAAANVDEGTLDMTPDGFDSLLATLRRYFNPIGLNELRDHLDGRPLPSHSVLLTFDDGYRDNLERALPLLLRHQLKAVFFIATHYVEHRRLFWWDRLSYALKHARQSTIELNYPHPLSLSLDSGVGEAERTLQQLIKTTRALDVNRLLDELVAAAQVQWDASMERCLADELILDWDGVRKLRAAGMEIGSHTRTHRVLQTVPESEWESELQGSRHDLEAKLDQEIYAIAYPVGRSIQARPELCSAVNRAGYRLGFTYQTGHQRLPVVDPFDVKRMSIDRDWNLSRIRAALAFPWLG